MAPARLRRHSGQRSRPAGSVALSGRVSAVAMETNGRGRYQPASAALSVKSRAAGAPGEGRSAGYGTPYLIR